MAHCVSNMIGIRAGGVFSGKVVLSDVRDRIKKIILEMRADDTVCDPDLGGKTGNPSHCMSKELIAHKGSYVVIAGVFNYWGRDAVFEFARRLSNEFGTDVMAMSWDEEDGSVGCQIYTDGQPTIDAHENPIGQILRRTL
ncbi:hypothetical protein M0R72_10750 [Candidatus Pacearchaeota archaeon]|nr:hypothetical protein [Candidatus Pacearchaeota archaeon]